MSYSIVFETKFVKLSDGRLLHLDRSGCNNDTAGRDLSDFTGTIYTKEGLNKRAEKFMLGGKKSKDEGWDLKIGSRLCSYYDYGQHLLRMAKRAITYEEFCSERHFRADRYDGVKVYEPEEKTLVPEEFTDYYYDALYGGKQISYRRLITPLKSESEIVDALDNKKAVSFYVGKKW